MGLFMAYLMAVRGSAQTSVYHIPGYSVTHITEDNGLPQNTIKGIAVGPAGYIWLATEAGLVRYDGRRFRLFTKQEMGTKYPRIAIMGRNPQTGNLYALTEDYEQVRLEPGNGYPVFVPLDSSLTDSNLSRRYGVPIGSDIFNRSMPFPMFENKWALMHVSADTFFLASSRHVTFRTPQKILWETDAVKKPGQYFFWYHGKLFLYNAQGHFDEVTPQGIKPALRISGYKKFIWNYPQNQAFILTQKNELLLLEPDAKNGLRLEPFMTGIPAGFDPGMVFHLQKQIVFLGSLRQGLLICKKQYFRTVSADGAGHNAIHYGILAEGNNIITSKKKRILPNGTEHTLINDDYNDFNVTLTRLGHDTVLFAQANDILVYSLKHEKWLKTIPMGDKITCLYTDTRHHIWVATADSGVYRLTPTLQPKLQFQVPYDVNTMNEVIPGHLLLGTGSGLFSYYMHQQRLSAYPHTQNLGIRHTLLSQKGYLYLSTYGDGIFMVDKNGNVYALPTDRLLYLKMAHCMLQDRKGRLWISTNKGLFCVPEKELLLYASGEQQQVMYHYFGQESGFKNSEFNGGCQPCGIKLASGEFAFPSMNGVVLFHPDSVHFLWPDKQLEVERISIDDVLLESAPDTVHVQRNFRQLEIYLTTPYYGSHPNMLLEYTTDSTRHDQWAPVHSDRRVSFTSLPSGYSYVTFRKKKIPSPGAYSYTTLVLYKPKAFWEFSLFWGLIILLGTLSVTLLIRFRMRTLKQRNRKLAEAIEKARRELLVTIDTLTETAQKLEKKTRFQQWLTSSIVHDLRGPLRFINFYGGDIRKEQDETTPAQNKFLKSVYFSALKIYNYSDNLVQLLRIEQAGDFPPEKTDFMELVDDKLEQFREQARWNNITLVLDPESDPFIYVNQAALSIILQNLLDNSIKNFKNGRVHLSLKNSDSRSVIEIQDEGPGMPPDLLWKFNQQPYDEMNHENASGLGLWLVKSLMVQTAGQIRFQNLPQKGLLVTLIWEIPME